MIRTLRTATIIAIAVIAALALSQRASAQGILENSVDPTSSTVADTTERATNAADTAVPPVAPVSGAANTMESVTSTLVAPVARSSDPPAHATDGGTSTTSSPSAPSLSQTIGAAVDTTTTANDAVTAPVRQTAPNPAAPISAVTTGATGAVQGTVEQITTATDDGVRQVETTGRPATQPASGVVVETVDQVGKAVDQTVDTTAGVVDSSVTTAPRVVETVEQVVPASQPVLAPVKDALPAQPVAAPVVDGAGAAIDQVVNDVVALVTAPAEQVPDQPALGPGIDPPGVTAAEPSLQGAPIDPAVSDSVDVTASSDPAATSPTANDRARLGVEGIAPAARAASPDITADVVADSPAPHARVGGEAKANSPEIPASDVVDAAVPEIRRLVAPLDWARPATESTPQLSSAASRTGAPGGPSPLPAPAPNAPAPASGTSTSSIGSGGGAGDFGAPVALLSVLVLALVAARRTAAWLTASLPTGIRQTILTPPG